ncbi:MAG: spore cortex biosynthesis protein YabQ [Clostridia bacterium]|nr:spore cortex biosynthesis protein YabQ [Clostridia bacterium]
MIISNFLQFKDFFLMLGIGILFGIIYDLLSTLPNIFQKLWIRILIDFIFSILYCLGFIILINFINLGEFRWYLIVGYILGTIIEQITLGNLFAKGVKYLYNKLVVCMKKFKSTRIGRFLLK